MANRRAPYPFDVRIAGGGLMLETDSKGRPLWDEQRVAPPQQQVSLTESDLQFARYPLQVEAPYALVDFSDGMGLLDQAPARRTQYQYALYADCSSGQPVCGPLPVAQTGVGSSVSQFIEFNGALYAIAGARYLWKRTGDTAGDWTLLQDFGATASIGQCAVFSGTATAPYVFMPMGGSLRYYALGTDDVAHQRAAATGDTVYHFCAIGKELWAAVYESGVWGIRKSEDGGFTATWGGMTTMGDPTYAITGLVAAADRLIVMKADTMMAPTRQRGTVVDEDLAPSLHPLATSTNGRYPVNWNESAVAVYGGLLERYDPASGTLEAFGPELLGQNQSEVAGPVGALAPQAGLALWAGLTNPSTGHSYLLRWGGWGLGTGQDGGPRRVFKAAWHGALYKWSSKTITAMLVTNGFGGGQPRLYCGLSDGSITYFVLSKTYAAVDDPNYRFNTTDTGYVYAPRYTGGDPLDTKLVRALGITARNLSSGVRLAAVDYRSAATTTWTALGTASADPGSRMELASAIAVKALDYRVSLSTTSATASPVLTGLVVYAGIRSPDLKEITAVVRVANNVLDRQERRLPKSWQDVRAALEAAMTADSAVTVIGPSGETLTVNGLGFAHHLRGYDEDTAEPRWSTELHFVQVTASATRGTWARAGAYTWQDLESYTWADLAFL